VAVEQRANIWGCLGLDDFYDIVGNCCKDHSNGESFIAFLHNLVFDDLFYFVDSQDVLHDAATGFDEWHLHHHDTRITLIHGMEHTVISHRTAKNQVQNFVERLPETVKEFKMLVYNPLLRTDLGRVIDDDTGLPVGSPIFPTMDEVHAMPYSAPSTYSLSSDLSTSAAPNTTIRPPESPTPAKSTMDLEPQDTTEDVLEYTSAATGMPLTASLCLPTGVDGSYVPLEMGEATESATRDSTPFSSCTRRACCQTAQPCEHVLPMLHDPSMVSTGPSLAFDYLPLSTLSDSISISDCPISPPCPVVSRVHTVQTWSQRTSTPLSHIHLRSPHIYVNPIGSCPSCLAKLPFSLPRPPECHALVDSRALSHPTVTSSCVSLIVPLLDADDPSQQLYSSAGEISRGTICSGSGFRLSSSPEQAGIVAVAPKPSAGPEDSPDIKLFSLPRPPDATPSVTAQFPLSSDVLPQVLLPCRVGTTMITMFVACLFDRGVVLPWCRCNPLCHSCPDAAGSPLALVSVAVDLLMPVVPPFRPRFDHCAVLAPCALAVLRRSLGHLELYASTIVALSDAECPPSQLYSSAGEDGRCTIDLLPSLLCRLPDCATLNDGQATFCPYKAVPPFPLPHPPDYSLAGVAQLQLPNARLPLLPPRHARTTTTVCLGCRVDLFWSCRGPLHYSHTAAVRGVSLLDCCMGLFRSSCSPLPYSSAASGAPLSLVATLPGLSALPLPPSGHRFAVPQSIPLPCSAAPSATTLAPAIVRPSVPVLPSFHSRSNRCVDLAPRALVAPSRSLQHLASRALTIVPPFSSAGEDSRGAIRSDDTGPASQANLPFSLLLLPDFSPSAPTQFHSPDVLPPLLLTCPPDCGIPEGQQAWSPSVELLPPFLLPHLRDCSLTTSPHSSACLHPMIHSPEAISPFSLPRPPDCDPLYPWLHRLLKQLLLVSVDWGPHCPKPLFWSLDLSWHDISCSVPSASCHEAAPLAFFSVCHSDIVEMGEDVTKSRSFACTLIFVPPGTQLFWDSSIRSTAFVPLLPSQLRSRRFGK
jgi:hypothetical protein